VLAKGIDINRVTKAVGLGVGTVQKIKNEMLKPEMASAAGRSVTDAVGPDAGGIDRRGQTVITAKESSS
jgi:hypothetical protein